MVIRKEIVLDFEGRPGEIRVEMQKKLDQGWSVKHMVRLFPHIVLVIFERNEVET